MALFVEGIKKDSQKLINVMAPRTLLQAITIAKKMTNEEDPYSGKLMGRDAGGSGVKHNNWFGWKQVAYTYSSKGQPANRSMGQEKGTSVAGGKNTPYRPPHKRPSTSEIEEKRAKGLCFWCDEKFMFNHKCANRRLYPLVLEREEMEQRTEERENPELEEEDVPILSLHALHGVDMTFQNQTMKLVGYYKKKKLNILVDSGSTHNFLDVAVAKQVGCPVQMIPLRRVMVANGKKK